LHQELDEAAANVIAAREFTRQIIVRGLLLLGSSMVLCALTRAQLPIRVPMDASHWHGLQADSMGPNGNPEFSKVEGFPQGLMTLKEGSAGLANLTFKDGSIEYDFKPIGEDAPGIQFRANGSPGSEDAEEFYFRTSSDCRASDDCIQYAPVIHGFMLWDVYPGYQHQAFLLDGWNHVRLVISGRRMSVYVNNMPRPALSVGNLESDSKSGSIHLRGPALYANLVVTPNLTNGLSPQPALDPVAHDPSIVRHWEVSDLVPISALTAPAPSDITRPTMAWHLVDAERGGFVNLNRRYEAGDQPATISWLRYSVYAKQVGVRKVSVGWIGQVWIYVNGKLVGDGKNFYYPATERRYPDGRLSLQNGTFDLPLHAGSNEVAIALYSQVRDAIRPRMKYGWGLMMRYNDMTGLSFMSGKPQAE
jgi:hypothetical protein